MRFIFTIVLISCVCTAAHAASKLPAIPELIFGVNQYNVGPPADLAKHWPLTDDDASYLKSIGCNTVRFPLYPAEVGIDEHKLMDWKTGDKFDARLTSTLRPDWRSLDALLDWMIKHQLTPFICPGAEIKEDWTSKGWMSLHVPENAQRAVWLTKLVVDHVTHKYGDNVIYGWYENWYWNSYKQEKSAEFPAAFSKMLSKMYGAKIADLNKAWGAGYKSFNEIVAPRLYVNGDVPEEVIDSYRSYDLRRAIDLMQRDVLMGIKHYIHQVAPHALWAGGCALNEFGGMNDIRTVGVPRTNATLRTCAATSDIVSVDLYGPKFLYYSYYRTVGKIAASEGKRFLVVEASAVAPQTFGWIAEAGGPSAGALAWCGKEDVFGFIKNDGTRRDANAQRFKQFCKAFAADPGRYGHYTPGHIRVYFPEETLYYSITARNQMDAYQHICDNMKPEELEPVLTDELAKLPPGAPIFVLERTIPLKAIKALAKLGSRVICPHSYFVDEFGGRHDRNVPKDFYAHLRVAPDGAKLLDVFQRVEEKENNVAYRYYGTTASSPSGLANANQVIPGRDNDLGNLIDGSIFDGVTFADKRQPEKVFLRLNQSKMIYGAFVQFYEGDGQAVAPSPLPAQVRILISADGVTYSEAAGISGANVAMRSRVRFAPVRTRYICFDFGENTRAIGLKIEELGVLGERR
jgi:hypothetical protein